MTRQTEILYIHVPFCIEKCDYCAFHSTDGVDSDLVEQYLDRLDRELAERCENCAPLRSIFIGGGTPTALEPFSLERFMTMIRGHFKLADDCEFTVECNPSSLTAARLAILRDAGVNRLSLGVQSFNERLRTAIGRRGDLTVVRRGLELAASAMNNVNYDLIFGITGQTLDDWHTDLKAVVNLGASHVSAYALTIEPSTPLIKRGVMPVEEDRFIGFWDMTDEVLNAAGLDRYEISNFAKPGRHCKHNDEIWHGRPYAAAGPAAHGFDGNQRYSNPTLADWLSGAPPTTDALTRDDRAVELFIIGLRTVVGWDMNELQELTGVDVMSLRKEQIDSLCSAALLESDGAIIRPTKRGLLLNDWVGGELI